MRPPFSPIASLLTVAIALAPGCSSSSPARDAAANAADAGDAGALDAPAPVTEPLPAQLVLAPARFSDLEGWTDDDHLAALSAFRRSCAALVGKKADTQVGLYPIAGTVADWKPACTEAATIRTSAGARELFEAQFLPYAVANNADRVGRFTGYYNARIRASRKKSSKYKTPVWGRPTDLLSINLADFKPELRGERIWGKLRGKRVVPYETRRQINAGAVRDRADVLFWADDPIDVFFAQVQGSAIIELDDGSIARIGVGGKNGHIYTAIGRVLIADGELTSQTVSMQSIRSWMLAHPDKARDLMEKNEAFVFFREVKGAGPYGAQGVVLTPGRSLAVDLRWLPMSAPLWVTTEVPSVGREATEPFRRLMIAQDTGGAIRGPVRGDIYFGDDGDAFDQAGRMKGVGSYHILLPRSINPFAADSSVTGADERSPRP